VANYSSGILDVHAASAYPGTAQVVMPFAPKFVTVTCEGPASTQIAFSFDGVADHGVLSNGGNYTTFPMQLDMRARQSVWLRSVSSVGTEKAQVMAWA
jgi:hypothetical protein